MDEKLNKTIDEKLNEGRSYRNMESFEIRAAEPEAKQVEGYATVFDVRYELFSYDNWNGYRVHVMEEVDRNAFAECDMSDTIMQYNHEGRVFARVSNDTLTVRPDTRGLFVSADLGGTELGRQLYEEIKGGYTNKMSFGFTVAKDERTEQRDDENKEITVIRKILKISRLWDVSAVSIPANDATDISARSYCDGVIEELKQELLRAEAREKQKQRIRILAEVNP